MLFFNIQNCPLQNIGISDTYPCDLTGLLGVEVQEFEPIHKNVNEQNIEYNHEIIPATHWIEELKCTTANQLRCLLTGTEKVSA